MLASARKPRSFAQGLRTLNARRLAATALAGFVIVAVTTAVALQNADSITAFVRDDAPVLLVPLVLWLLLSERYELTLAFCMLYLGLLDGPIKLTSGSTLGTLGRDAILWSISLGCLIRVAIRHSKPNLPRETAWVVGWIVLCLMQVPNPGDSSLLHAVASLRQHLEFVPLFFFGYVLMRSPSRLEAFCFLLIGIAALNGIVTVIQSHLTPSQLAAWGPGYSQLEYGGGGFFGARVFFGANGLAQVRPPGLGGADGTGAQICALAIPALFALLSTTRDRRKLLVAAVCAIPIFLGVAFGESHGALGMAVISVLAFAFLTIDSRGGLAVTLAVAAVCAGGYFAVSSLLSPTATRYNSSSIAISTDTRVVAAKDIPKYFVEYPLGAGLGSVGSAGNSSVGGASNKDLDGDDQLTFLLIEVGIPGALLMVSFTVAMIVAGWRLRRIRDPRIQRPLVAMTAAWIGMVGFWFAGPVTATSPTSPFIWFTAGVLVYWAQTMRRGGVQRRGGLLRRATLAV